LNTTNYKKPKIGKEVWVLVYPYYGEPSKVISKETVGWLGTETFIPLYFEDYVSECQQFRYDDYNKIWFTSLAAAKAKLKELNPGCKLRPGEFFPDSVWEVVE
jgi:hypothetical protein